MKRLLPLVILSALSLASCNIQGKWTYPLDSSRLFRGTVERPELVVAVLPFKEERPVANQAGTFWLYLVPLVPFGFVSYERPGAARFFNTLREYDFTLDEDLAKAAARSCEISGLFKRAYFTSGGETREADYLLEASVERFHYDGKILTYGVLFGGQLMSAELRHS